MRLSSPSLARSRETWTSIERSKLSSAEPFARSSSCSRDSTLPGPLRERAQDRELVRGDVDRLAVERRPSSARDRARAADLIVVLARAGLAADAAHVRADPREQLARRERLGDVVVGADLEAEHAIGFFAARGHHDDRHVDARAQLAADLDAVAAGQHQIEHDAVVLAAQRLGLALDAVARRS